MNLVNAVGGTKKQRRLAERVAEYCIEELMPRHRTLDIEIHLNNCRKESGVYGLCYAMNTEREFTIEIDKTIDKFKNGKPKKAGRELFIETVCHEMVHVMQTAKGLMIDRVRPTKLGYRRLWKNRKGTYTDHTKKPYSRQPWERQAYEMEGPLKKKYLKLYDK